MAISSSRGCEIDSRAVMVTWELGKVTLIDHDI
jgi:hypothetical protein